MIRLMALIITLLLTDVALGRPVAVAEADRQTDAISAADYALYDQVVTSKFLTSATQLVVIERMTRLHLSPGQEGSTTIGAFQDQGYFDGGLPADLVREFISVNREPSRLEGRFHFAVGYRFAMEGRLEEPEVSLAPYGWGLAPFFSTPVAGRGAAGEAPSQMSEPVPRAHAKLVQAPSVLDRLAFSREAFATIRRCCTLKSYGPMAPERDSSCGVVVEDKVGSSSIRRLLGHFRRT
jgi:hypothetical protein